MRVIRPYRTQDYEKDIIIQNLYDVSKLEHFMNDMEDGIDYNILVNTNETGNNSSFTPAPCQIMDRFCIINPLNFSHTIYQNFIYGYYLDITEDRILSINPSPIDFDPNITKKKDIGVSVLKGRSPNYWLSMKMFNDITYQNGIYGSIMIETKKDNQFLIHTPTMRTPEEIVDPRIIYQCMRTTLIVAKKNNIKRQELYKQYHQL